MKTSASLLMAVCLAFSLAPALGQKAPAGKKAAAATLQVEANKAAYRVIVEECFEKGNMAAADQYVAPDFVNHDLRDKSAGLEGFKQMVLAFREAFPDLDAEIESLVGEGDRTVARVRFRGTNTGMHMGRPATNRKVEVIGYDDFRWKDGKAVEHWGLFDNLAMLQQLGVLPTVEPIVKKPAPAPRVAEVPEEKPEGK